MCSSPAIGSFGRPQFSVHARYIIKEPNCLYVHFAPPYGTASRARFIKRKGRHNPLPLRSDRWPKGLPQLTGLHLAKVQSANKLYDLTQQLCRFCIECGVYFSIENPARSFMWDTEHMANFLCECFHYKTFFHPLVLMVTYSKPQQDRKGSVYHDI